MSASTKASMARARAAVDPALDEAGIRAFEIAYSDLVCGRLRLDAGHYSEDVTLADALLRLSGFEILPLTELASRIFMMPLKAKMVYATGPETGEAYLTQSQLLQAKPRAQKWVHLDKMDHSDTWHVKQGWILVTQSGTVGLTVMASKHLETFVISPNPLRVITKKGILSGYVYAYLSSWVGRVLMVKDQFGSTVKHLLPFHLENLPVPLVSSVIQRSIHDVVVEAYRLRDDANQLLDQADALLYKELGLPRLDESAVDYYGAGDVKAFERHSSELNLRLDARYSTPVVELIEDNINRAAKDRGFGVKTLKEVTADIFIPGRFKRAYVEEKYGVPFLQGVHIVQFKPFDVKCISRSLTENLDSYILGPLWTLVTCSGTLGRTSFVGSDIEGWAATQHIMRVVPDTKVIDAGYLYSFLSSAYGYWQIFRNRYGAVVDEIAAEQVTDVLVPYPSQPLQKRIGGLVIKAYDNRAKANGLENQAIKLLEDTLVEAYQKRTGRGVAVR